MKKFLLIICLQLICISVVFSQSKKIYIKFYINDCATCYLPAYKILTNYPHSQIVLKKEGADYLKRDIFEYMPNIDPKRIIVSDKLYQSIDKEAGSEVAVFEKKTLVYQNLLKALPGVEWQIFQALCKDFTPKKTNFPLDLHGFDINLMLRGTTRSVVTGFPSNRLYFFKEFGVLDTIIDLQLLTHKKIYEFVFSGEELLSNLKGLDSSNFVKPMIRIPCLDKNDDVCLEIIFSVPVAPFEMYVKNIDKTHIFSHKLKTFFIRIDKNYQFYFNQVPDPDKDSQMLPVSLQLLSYKQQNTFATQALSDSIENAFICTLEQSADGQCTPYKLLASLQRPSFIEKNTVNIFRQDKHFVSQITKPNLINFDDHTFHYLKIERIEKELAVSKNNFYLSDFIVKDGLIHLLYYADNAFWLTYITLNTNEVLFDKMLLAVDFKKEKGRFSKEKFALTPSFTADHQIFFYLKNKEAFLID